MHTIGIDIGGTKINFILLKGKEVVRKENILIPKNQKGLLKEIESTVKKMTAGLSGAKIKGAGIGVPGALNEKGTLILNPPNLTYLRYSPLAKIVERRLKIKTRMENDVNCFTLAEAVLGAGKGAKDVLGITLGTGVGGGIVINGKIQRGSFGAAGEVGHMTINYNGLKCSCGGLGCLEEYASQRFFFRKGANPIAFWKKAVQGDKRALNVYREYGRYLGVGIANCINILDPQIVVIGGGISNSYRFFIEEARKEISQRVVSPISKKRVKIKEAKLKDWAGAMGAALLPYNN